MRQVELKAFVNDFIAQYKDALLKHELYGIEEFDSLLTQLTLFQEGVSIQEDTYIDILEHPIDKFGLGEVVLKFVNNSFTYTQIAEIVSVQAGVVINKSQVKDWVDNYSHITKIQQVQGHGNLFDVQERMQDIFGALQEHLETVKTTNDDDFYKARTTKAQVVLETYKEIRALTKDAANIIQSISHQQQLQEFRKVIIESIKEVSPSMAQAVIRKLKQNKALYNSLLPGD